MNNDNVMVSVYCLAYNHGRFIKAALDGFVSQKTDFKYEVFVHDDASADNTAEIIREYAAKYPDIIKPIFQTENQYSKKLGIVKNFILPEMRGKYVAACEGDDFWTDPLKLQRQVEALEANPSCSLCFNKVEIGDIKGKPLPGQTIPSADSLKDGVIRDGVIKSVDFLRFAAYPGPLQHLLCQLAGCMWRKDLYDEYNGDKPDFAKKFDVGDLPLFLYLGSKGDVYFIDRIMSFYRTNNPVSASAKMWNHIPHLEADCDALKEFDKYSNGVIHDAILKALKNREFEKMTAVGDLKGLRRADMKELYKALSIKMQIKSFFACYMPFSVKVYDFIKIYIRKLRNKRRYKK